MWCGAVWRGGISRYECSAFNGEIHTHKTTLGLLNDPCSVISILPRSLHVGDPASITLGVSATATSSRVNVQPQLLS